MASWTLPQLYADENGVSRVDPPFTQERTAVEFATPAPPLFVVHVADAQALDPAETARGGRPTSLPSNARIEWCLVANPRWR